jgi:hypothetical protein
VVSLESLKQESSTGAKPAVVALSPETPSAVVELATQPKTQTVPPAAAPEPVFKAAPARGEPTRKATRIEKALPSKNDADMTPRERLNAAISASMTSSSRAPKRIKARPGSEYDPLNPTL